MMSALPIRCCLAALCVVGGALPAVAEQALSEPNLARAVAIFQRADADRNGSLDAQESLKARIPKSDVVRYDGNRDGRLSRDEFVTYYRRLLADAGVRVSRDLEAESVRIQAMRRAQRAREDRARDAGSRSADPAAVTSTGAASARRLAAGRSATAASSEPVRRAKALLQWLSTSDRLGPTEARDLQALVALIDAPSTADSRERARGHIGRLSRGGILSEAQVLELRAVLVDPPPPRVEVPVRREGGASGGGDAGSGGPPAKGTSNRGGPPAATGAAGATGSPGSRARTSGETKGEGGEEAPSSGPFR